MRGPRTPRKGEARAHGASHCELRFVQSQHWPRRSERVQTTTRPSCRRPGAGKRNVAIGITRHHGAWAANAIVSGRELARTPCPGRVDRDTYVLFTGRGAGGSAGGMGCVPTLADSPAASIRTSPGPVAPPWSTAAAGWGTVGSNRTLLHTPPGNPAGPLALDARDSSPPTARSP